VLLWYLNMVVFFLFSFLTNFLFKGYGGPSGPSGGFGGGPSGMLSLFSFFGFLLCFIYVFVLSLRDTPLRDTPLCVCVLLLK